MKAASRRPQGRVYMQLGKHVLTAGMQSMLLCSQKWTGLPAICVLHQHGTIYILNRELAAFVQQGVCLHVDSACKSVFDIMSYTIVHFTRR